MCTLSDFIFRLFVNMENPTTGKVLKTLLSFRNIA